MRERCLVRKPSAGLPPWLSTMTSILATLLRGEKEPSVNQLHEVSMAPREAVQGGGLKRPGVKELQIRLDWAGIGTFISHRFIKSVGPDQHPIEARVSFEPLKLARREPLFEGTTDRCCS